MTSASNRTIGDRTITLTKILVCDAMDLGPTKIFVCCWVISTDGEENFEAALGLKKIYGISRVIMEEEEAVRGNCACRHADGNVCCGGPGYSCPTKHHDNTWRVIESKFRGVVAKCINLLGVDFTISEEEPD